MKQHVLTMLIALVILSCKHNELKKESEQAHFYLETMLGFEYIVNSHYKSYQESFGTFYSGAPNEQQQRLKNVFDANFELKGIVDYRMIEENGSEEEKRTQLFDGLDSFVKKTRSNVPEYYKADFNQYLKNMQFNRDGFNEIHVLDSTDRHMFLTKVHMVTTRAVQMNY